MNDINFIKLIEIIALAIILGNISGHVMAIALYSGIQIAICSAIYIILQMSKIRMVKDEVNNRNKT